MRYPQLHGAGEHTHRIVIVGGSFGGINAAYQLRRDWGSASN